MYIYLNMGCLGEGKQRTKNAPYLAPARLKENGYMIADKTPTYAGSWRMEIRYDMKPNESTPITPSPSSIIIKQDSARATLHMIQSW